MALTFSEKLSMPLGSKLFKAYLVTHDGSETSIDCSSLDMKYIDMAWVSAVTTTDYPDLPTYQGTSLAVTALSAGATTMVFALGH